MNSFVIHVIADVIILTDEVKALIYYKNCTKPNI